MITIQDKDHFKAAIAFSRTQPSKTRQSLRRSFKTLNRIKRNYQAKSAFPIMLIFSRDFVAHSWIFSFVDPNGNRCGLNGGLILHGYEETFSIELNSNPYPHWSIHT